MFTANLDEFEIRQNEMIRQAKAYRLTKLAAGSNDLVSIIINLLGKLIGQSGQQTLTLSEANR
jgi:hypothetical protein